MRIQWKLLLLISLVLVGTTSAVIWKSRALLVKDKLGSLADSSTKQLAPFKRLVKERLDEQKTRLVTFATSRASLGAGRARLPDGFDAVALMKFSPADGQWAQDW